MSPSSSQNQTWLITGCSSGIGYHLAISALAAGHAVIATSRDASCSAATAIRAAGGQYIALGVTSPTLNVDVSNIVSECGRIDVLVSNAGVAAAGSTEDTPIEDARMLLETNVIGPLRLMQTVLPVMRERGHGTIVNVASASIFAGEPGVGVYAGCKAVSLGAASAIPQSKGALTLQMIDVLSESLAKEVAEFGIGVVVAIPGATRTSFNSAGKLMPMGESYANGAVGNLVDWLRSQDGKQKGDPSKCAQRILEAVDGTGLLNGVGVKKGGAGRLLLGEGTAQAARARGEELLRIVEEGEAACKSTDFQ